MAYLEEFLSALTSPLFSMWQILLENFVGIVSAAIVVIIGYLVGSALGFLLSKLLEHSKVDEHVERLHMHDALGFIKFHALLGLLLKWYVVSLFVAASTALIPSVSLAGLIEQFAFWLPSFLAGILIFTLGLIFAEAVHSHFQLTKTKGMRLLGEALKVTFILIAALIALDQMQVQIQLASNIVLILVGGIALAGALAVGIGGGLALKDEAHDWFRRFHKK